MPGNTKVRNVKFPHAKSGNFMFCLGCYLATLVILRTLNAVLYRVMIFFTNNIASIKKATHINSVFIVVALIV